MSFSKKDISKQLDLTSKRLEKIATGYHGSDTRPESSFIELMHWAKRYIQSDSSAKDTADLIPFIHNKISIDGAFLQFCEENHLDVRALHTDSITSWKSEEEDEHFVSVGIFEIKGDGFLFYHCGLFHKGNQNEDEVSFFILVSPKHLQKYKNIRNEFDKWQKKRERDCQEIEVIGGEPISYDLNVGWDDVFLPEDLKAKIKTSVEGFLKSKDIYKKLKVPWRRGIGFWGPQGCGKTSMLRLLMAQYQEFKPVTIQPGHNQPDELLEDAFRYAEEHAPSLLFFEDLQEMIKSIDMRHFLQLLDGLQKRDGILTVVTGNDFADLEENLKSRPRRFDAFLKFPLPNVELSKKYLMKYFNDILSAKKIESIAKKAVENEFTYAHLQEVYFNAVFIAIPEGREIPSEADINKSIKQVIAEKQAADSDFVTKKRDLTDEIESEEDK